MRAAFCFNHGERWYRYATGAWGRSADAEKRFGYDPAKAQQLLDAAGWTAGSDGIRQRVRKTRTASIYGRAGSGDAPGSASATGGC